MKHLAVNDLLKNNHYGLQSTTLQLLHVLDKWTEMIDRCDSFDVLYIFYLFFISDITSIYILKTGTVKTGIKYD